MAVDYTISLLMFRDEIKRGSEYGCSKLVI